MRLDPHTPENGWLELTSDLMGAGAPKDARITALGIGASGAAIFALEPASQDGSSSLTEIDRTDRTIVQRSPAPSGVERIACDGEGNLWLQCKNSAYRRPPAADAWQRRWQLVDRIPAGDHDLSGDVMDGRFYMAGGQNAGWGYPAKPHVFRELMAFDPAVQRWSVVALLDQPRFYNGTSWLDGRVWIIGGNTRDAQYNSVTLSSVQIWDPKSKTLTDGPPLPMALDNPVALHIHGRIYCAGFTKSDKEAEPCLLFSIGKDETSWRREPEGPSYKVALAATAYQDSLYLAVPGKGLGCFDTKDRTWKLISFAHPVRSPQMASYHDQIWIMGGRDIDHQDQTILYKPSDGSWSCGPNLPRELAWGAGTVIGGKLMVVGGAAGRGYNNRTFYLRKHPI
jgi:N-acetylneuraminic acid mutarotase